MIAFIGLGRMGRPMASNLCRKGFALAVFDIDPQAVSCVSAIGAQPAETAAAAAAASDIVMTMLPNTAVVEDVLAGTGGVMARCRPGATIVDMSTIDPLATDRLARAAGDRGLRFVDAPVGRLATHADRGECLFMVGGSAEDYARVKPLLDAMGTTVHHCGPVGTGMRTKLVNNYLAIVSCQLNAEALALSQRFGLSLERTLDVISGTTATNGQLKINWPNKVLKDDLEPGFTIDLAHKDLTLIVEAAQAAKVPVAVAAAAREAFSSARARGYGSKDFSAMVDALCDLADIRKPRFGPPA